VMVMAVTSGVRVLVRLAPDHTAAVVRERFAAVLRSGPLARRDAAAGPCYGWPKICARIRTGSQSGPVQVVTVETTRPNDARVCAFGLESPASSSGSMRIGPGRSQPSHRSAAAFAAQLPA